MGSSVLHVVRGATPLCSASVTHNFILNRRSFGSFSKLHIAHFNKARRGCSSSTTSRPALQPPDVSNLAETARISLTPTEIEEFEPKIRQVIGWFGQLQDVDLRSVEPSIRAETDDSNLRDDAPDAFDQRDAMIAAVPSYEEPYIKVPKVLNKE